MTYGIVNLHTEHSINKSIIKIDKAIKKAVETGCNVLAITDYNTMTGAMEFVKSCKNADIKPLIGVEVTIYDNNNSYLLSLIAKNYQGYQNICKIITMANIPLSKNEDSIYLTYNDFIELLDKDNVIVLSGADEGIFYAAYTKNIKTKEKIEELKKQIEKCDSPTDSSYIGNLTLLQDCDNKISSLTDEKKNLKKIADRKLEAKYKGIEAYRISDPVRFEKEKNVLDNMMHEKNKAKAALKDITSKLSSIKKTRTNILKKISLMEENHKQYNVLSDTLKNYSNAMKSRELLINDFQSYISKYKKITNNFFIQIYYDGTEQTGKIALKLLSLAQENNVPYFITAVPYMENAGEEKALQITRSLKNNTWEELKGNEHYLYMMSKEEIIRLYSDIMDEKYIKTALTTLSQICDNCSFDIPDTKHYPKYIDNNGNIVQNSEDLLRELTIKGIKDRGFTNETFTKEYSDRLDYELNTIIDMGFADYILIVADFVNYGKSISPYNVGPGRGSAAGSLVCYFMKITNMDPIIYNLKFERFLNVARVTMPDIDIDFGFVRDDVVKYAINKYGAESVSLIRTAQTQQINATIHNTARLYGIEKHNNKMHYAELGNKICKYINDNDCNLDNCKENLHTFISNEKEYEDALTIIDNGKLINGTITSIGVHAAGIIIGDGNPLYTYAPLLFNKEMQQWVIQYDMVESEEINLLKIDFLGLKTLNILTETIDRIRKYTGVSLDLSHVPFKTEVFEEVFSKGNTSGIFQFESEGMRNMLKKFKPQSFEDIMLLVAAYRPGPLDFIQDIIDVKNGNKKPNYCVPELENILSCTYGYPIYQEQLMDIFANCANFTQGEADIIRRYMSKKKEEKFLEYKPQFIEGVKKHGASNEEAVDLWNSLVSFAKYGFNKSHACVYALISYQTAYLKYYYKEYYMCAVLNHAENKIGQYLHECYSMNIKLLPPFINRTHENFENIENGIIFGLNKVKSIKSKDVTVILEERMKNGAYSSYKDFLARNKITDSFNTLLINAGCFDEFGNKRSQLQNSYNVLSVMLDKIKDCKNNIEKFINEGKNTERYEEMLKKEIDTYNNYKYLTVKDNENYYEKEKEILFYYISSHPLDTYKSLYKKANIKTINELVEGKAVCIGIISNLKIVQRKSDGANMAFFELEDYTSSIKVCCFPEQYKKNKNYIQEGKIIKVIGNVTKQSDKSKNPDDIQFVINTIENCIVKKTPVLISIKDRSMEMAAYNILKEYAEEDGYEIWLHLQDTGMIEKKYMSVSKKALNLNTDIFSCKLLFDYK